MKIKRKIIKLKIIIPRNNNELLNKIFIIKRIINKLTKKVKEDC